MSQPSPVTWNRALSLDRVSIWCGFLAPIIALGCVGLSTVVASSAEFTWAEYALSDLGRQEAATFWLFNGGLLAGGLAGIPFAWPLWRRAQNRTERVATGTFLITVVGLALIGVFYLPRDLHGPVALLFFFGGPVTHWLYGVGRIRAGTTRFGWYSVGFGCVHALSWAGWILFTQATGSNQWFAVPEMVASVAFGLWSIMVARRLLAEPPA
jgi:hypothetical membrane protein